MSSVAPSICRVWSVSSRRKMNFPPAFRAMSQVYRAVRRLPTCIYPVGDGAKRVRTVPVGIRASSSSYQVRSIGRASLSMSFFWVIF